MQPPYPAPCSRLDLTGDAVVAAEMEASARTVMTFQGSPPSPPTKHQPWCQSQDLSLHGSQWVQSQPACAFIFFVLFFKFSPKEFSQRGREGERGRETSM